MELIQQINDELTTAETFEQVRLNGYDEILSMPASLLSNTTRDEVIEAMKWSKSRLLDIQQSIDAVKKLITGGYPSRVQQIADQTVITELQNRLEMMRLAVAEFQTPPVATVNISDEIAIN